MTTLNEITCAGVVSYSGTRFAFTFERTIVSAARKILDDRRQPRSAVISGTAHITRGVLSGGADTMRVATLKLIV